MTAKTELILVVDDDDSHRNLVCRFLGNCGYPVQQTNSAVHAMEMIRQSRPDIIISDVVMPIMTGLELLKACQAEFENIPFILITGHGSMDQVIEGLEQGAWDYLMKPLIPMKLLEHSIYKVTERISLIQKANKKEQELITNLEQKKLSYELELHHRLSEEKRALNAADEWHKTVDALPDMIAIIDSDQKIQRFNKPMLDFFRKSANEILGSKCLLCSQEHHCMQHRVIASNTPKTTEVYLEHRDIHLEVTITPYTSPDSSFVGTIHVYRDITLQKQEHKEKEVLLSQRMQAQKLESVGQLAAGIAHEINTPTQFVSSNLMFLNDAFSEIATFIKNVDEESTHGPISRESLTKKINDLDWDYFKDEIPIAATQAMEGIRRITSIVGAMKEFSHPGNNSYELIDINHLIDITMTVARNEWKYAAEISLNLSNELPEVPCLSNELGQVVLNLLVNAAHAIQERIGKTPEKARGHIAIGTALVEDFVQITIEDDGSGIPLNIQKKIYDPFFTTKTVGHGTGQGLAIAYDVIVNKHKGKLTFNSEVEQGTKFSIWLPI